jgi:MFS family permease
MAVFVGAALASTGCISLATLRFAWELGLAGGLMGIATSVYYPALQAYLVTLPVDRVLVVTAYNSVVTLALVSGTISGGLIAGVVGYPVLFAVLAAVSVFGGVLLLPSRNAAPKGNRQC